ncbi:MAG: arginase family protein [Actinomycetota bacterium]|nr:arginase family protein [Actinomycetota bacterium]
MDAGVAVRLLQVPYDSGVFDARMGAGPFALAGAGAARRLRGRGHAVREQVLAPSSEAGWRAELVTAFELHHAIANAVTAARAVGQVPLMLSGNCNATLGVLAGMTHPGRRLGLVWLDAHGDFNTPDTDTTGFLDGHGLAMAVGRCWQGVTARIPGFTPVPERQILLAGARSLDDLEEAALADSDVTWLRPAQARDPDMVDAVVDDLADVVDAVHFHVDLDVHDPSIAPANSYAAPDGLSADEVQALLRRSIDRLPVVSATLASYDPAFDPVGRMQNAALDLLELLADLATPVDA